MKKHKKFFILLTLLMLILTLSVGCGVETDEEAVVEETTEEKVFIIGRATDAVTLDPGYGYYEGEIDLIYHLYEGLVRYKDEEFNVEPALAEDWEVSEDGTLWTFYLREGVKFHDGTDFNADAVEFSFMRILDENHPYYGLGDQGLAYMDWLLADAISEVRAVDEYVVEFELNDIFGPFLMYLGLYSQYIVSPTAVEEHGKDYYNNPSGTGPFKFTEWRSEEYIKMETFEDYWGDKPAIDSIIWKVVPDVSTRLMELQAGQVHAIKTIDPAQVDTVRADENLELLQIPGTNIFFAAINHLAEPFDDVRVRRAVMHAIDFDSLVDTVYAGLGTRATTPLPPTVFGFNDEAEYANDVELAVTLLEEAGYPDGFEFDMHVFAESRSYIGRPIDAAEIISSDLAKAGIKANVIVNEWGTHRAILHNFEHSIGFVGWFDVPHPNNFLNALLLRATDSGYQPDELSELSDQALASYERAEQVELYKKMQEISHRDVGMMPIAHSDYTTVVLSDISGFELDALGAVRAHNVSF